MKRILFGCIAILFVSSSPLLAQSKVSKRDVQKATNDLIALYQLDQTQQQKAYEIQERKLENLAQVETINKTDYDTYLRKRRAVQIGADHAIKRLLNESQLKIYQEKQEARRALEAEKMRELKLKGASKEEIQRALLEIQ